MRRWFLAAAFLVGCSSGEDTPAPSPGSIAGDGGAGGSAAGAAGASGGGAGQGGALAGASGSGQAGAAQVCIPGASVACVGPGACQGGQVCKADGSGLGPCDCGSAGSGGAGAGGAGAGGAGGGAGGSGGSAGGGGGCVPKTEGMACQPDQCNPAPDGCGGDVSCKACPNWQLCGGPNSVQTCEGSCKEAPLPAGMMSCKEKFGDLYPTSIVCPDEPKPAPDSQKCQFVTSVPSGTGNDTYRCCAP